MQIVGRSSSLFTRMPLIFAEELGVTYELVPIYDMKDLSSETYGGHPAMKLPTLLRDGSAVFGSQNMCRAITERADRTVRIVWPEELRDDVSRNAQELVWHCMSAQVQLVFGTLLAKLPADNIYFSKAQTGFEGALRWLDAHLQEVMRALPSPRDLSLFEVSLFCLVDHLIFRPTVAVEPYASLLAFAQEFSQRPAAQRTPYKFDAPPLG